MILLGNNRNHWKCSKDNLVFIFHSLIFLSLSMMSNAGQQLFFDIVKRMSPCNNVIRDQEKNSLSSIEYTVFVSINEIDLFVFDFSSFDQCICLMCQHICNMVYFAQNNYKKITCKLQTVVKRRILKRKNVNSMICSVSIYMRKIRDIIFWSQFYLRRWNFKMNYIWLHSNFFIDYI